MKAFRKFTKAIPLAEKTTVLTDGFSGFANTVEEKLAMAREAYNTLYIAWPGEHETHIFQATSADVIGVLAPTPPAFAVGDLVRVRPEYDLLSAKAGLVGVVRLLGPSPSGDKTKVGVALAGYRGGDLQGRISTRNGAWIPVDALVLA